MDFKLHPKRGTGLTGIVKNGKLEKRTRAGRFERINVKMQVLRIFLAVAGLAIAVPAFGASPAAKPFPALWAMYYAWYETAPGPHGKWQLWTDDTTANPAPSPARRPSR